MIPFFDPQKHTNKRNTKTLLFFNKFSYHSDWIFLKKHSIFQENFKFKNEPFIRRNKHKLYYHKQKDIVKISKKQGFKLVKIIDEFTVGFSNNYILCFQKIYGY